MFFVYFVANSLLRLAVDGKIVMCVYPPGFISKRGQLFFSSPEASALIDNGISLHFISFHFFKTSYTSRLTVTKRVNTALWLFDNKQ